MGVRNLELLFENLHNFREDFFRFYAGETSNIFESALPLSMPAAGAAREFRMMNRGVAPLGCKAEQGVSGAKDDTHGGSEEVGRMTRKRVARDYIARSANQTESFC